MSNAQRHAPPTSTAYQQQLIRLLFVKNELSTGKFTLMHRIPFAAARLPEPPVDAAIDPHVQALTFSQASALIAALRKQAGIEDDDDEP
jgi:hypothetical protein